VPTIPIEKFQQTLLSAERPLVFSVVRNDRGTIRNDPVDAATDASLPDAEPLALTVQPAGPPIRIGISWRADAAEPQSVYLTHVVPGSAAGAAGLKVYDRIYEVDGQRFADKDDFGLEISLLVESYGRLRPVTLQIAESRPDIAQNSSRGSTTE
jgi:S1-C subfamily serine protease